MNSMQNNHHLISAVFSSVATTSAKQAKSKTLTQPKQKSVAATKPPQQSDKNPVADGWIKVATKNIRKATVPDEVKSAKSGNYPTKKVASLNQAPKKADAAMGNSKIQIGVTIKSVPTENKPAPSFLSIMGYSSQTSKRSRRRRSHKKKSQEQPMKENDASAVGDFDNTVHTATTASCASEMPSHLGSEPGDDNDTLMQNGDAEEDKPLMQPSALLALPYDILTGGVLSFLRPEDMVSLGRCNKTSKQITEDGFLWQNLFRERFPESKLTPRAMQEWKLAYKLTLSKLVNRMRCFFTKQTFFEDVLGVGLDFTVNPKTKLVDYISVSQDILSQTAFSKHKVRTDVFGNKFQVFLPLYFSEDHFQRALPQIQKTIFGLCPEKRLQFGSFHPSMVLDVFPKIITTFVVLLSDEGVSASRKSFTGLIRIHRLFLALAHQYPTIKVEAIQRLKHFVDKEGNRSKESCPSLGAILPLLMVVDQHDFNWAKIRPAYLNEMFDRAVLWVCKEHPKLETTTQSSGNPETVEQCEERVMLTRSAMTVVLRLTMFHAYFLTACCKGTTQDRSNKYDCFFGQTDPADNPSSSKVGEGHDGVSNAEDKLDAKVPGDEKEESPPVLSFSHFREQVNRIHSSTTWKSFFQLVGLRGPRCKEDMAKLLRQHVKNSRRKKYHKAGMDFARVQASGTSQILAKGQTYSASSELCRVSFHDSWSFTGHVKFLDATCLLYRGKLLVGNVDYLRRTGGDGAVRHSGDILRDGVGTHTIHINLSQLQPEITSCVFVISAFNGATLSDILTPTISFTDADKDLPLCVYHLDSEDKVSHLTSVVMCKLYRTRKESWHVQAIGDAYGGDASNYGPIYKAVQTLL
jgi:stress response protein SCP2